MEATRKTGAEGIPKKRHIEAPVKTKIRIGETKRSKDYVFHLLGDYRRVSHGRQIYPTVSVSNVDIIIDPDTGRMRTIRLLNGIPTLYKDEQNVPENVVPGIEPSLTFINGILRVPANDKMTYDFLMMKNCCLNNENRDGKSNILYYLEDYEKKESEEFELAKLSHEAEGLALKADKEQILFHGKFLNMLTTNADGEPLSLSGLRKRYAEIARKEPETFMATFNDKKIKIHYLVHQAVINDIIKIDRSTLKAYWSSGSTICVIPEKGDPIKYLTDFCYTKDGEAFRAQLESLAQE